MGARFRSWVQYLRKHRIVTIIIALVIAAMVLIFVESLINGTGFNSYYTTSTTRTISGSPPIITRTETYQPGKTMWDWFQLLIIPAVLAIAGYTINLTISRSEQESTRLRDQTEHEIAEDNQREAALQDYIDKMSELLLEKKLRESPEGNEVRKIARVRTLSLLARLDANRKRSVLQFLHESGLIEKDKHIIDLQGANLTEAKLCAANLTGADLTGANLNKASVRDNQLTQVKSLAGATMPDGSIHP